MQVKILSVSDNWLTIKQAALTTVNKETNTEPTPEWKRGILLAEHSPIRLLKIHWKWVELPSFVSVHFVRHKFGIEHFVRSQRTDRTGVDRNVLKQDELIEHEAEANAQAIINISRKRICNQASMETRKAWRAFLEAIKDREPELYSVCVPECVYRGFCPELKGCGFADTKEFKEKLKEYRAGNAKPSPEAQNCPKFKS